MERVQILLEPIERKALKQLADDAHTSMSDIVREMLRERIKEAKRKMLRQAATWMADEYRNDPELTSTTTAFFAEDGTDASR